MLKDIVEVRPLDGHRLWLRFQDGKAGIVDVAALVRFEGVFAPLADDARFREVRVLSETGTIGWPGGADLDPDVLYAHITKERIATTTLYGARTSTSMSGTPCLTWSAFGGSSQARGAGPTWLKLDLNRWSQLTTTRLGS